MILRKYTPYGTINHHGRVRTVAENGLEKTTKTVSWIPGNINNGFGKTKHKIMYIIFCFL